MPKNNEQWTITLDGFGGFCPAYFENSYPYYGNKTQASAMRNINLIDPNVLTQGGGVAALTGGIQTGELGSVLITSILKHAASSNVSYASGADKVFKITNTAVSNGNFPKTLAAGTANVSTDVLYYKSKLLVFWNDTGVDGDIGLLTNATTWDDDWGSTTPTGAAQLEDAPHYGLNAGDDVAYFTNGKYVGSYDGTTLTVQGLDFWTDAETSSLAWYQNRVVIAVNRPNVSGSNFNQSGIYRWDGVASSWEGDPIEVSGRIGALYVKNGVLFVWWQDSISTGGYQFGYVDGLQLMPLRRYSGSLPNQAQVGEYKGYLAWVNDDQIFLWGSRDADVPVKLFQFIEGQYATIGTFAAPFGSLIVSSTASTNYSLAKESGYTVTSTYNTMAFKVSGPDYVSQIDLIQVETEQMATGAAVDCTLTYNQGKSTQSLTQIAYSTSNITRHKILIRARATVEDFRLDFDFEEGSATNPVKIRSIHIQGHYIKDN